MLIHREDSIKERNEKEREQQAIKYDLELALAAIAELGASVAPLIEATETTEGGTNG